MSFLAKLEGAKAGLAAQDHSDPWLLPLARVRGKIEFDGLERMTSQSLLDLLEVPQRDRRAGTFRRLARVMVELGWTPVRLRGFTRGAYLEQVRGYARDARSLQTSHPPDHPHGSDKET